ncbi:ABC transporter ATP-binding protein, partial [Dactylosporangium fulvum]|uniref:ABC transporter ATP-binding protein n=1 Tax=Dactylosporangium fulvum TaxID=53359 RepID=UPI0031E26399
PVADAACTAAEPALDVRTVPGRAVRCIRPGAAPPASGPGPAATEPSAPPPAAAPLLEVRGLVRRHGRSTVLDHVDLTVAAGASVGLVGESGCGKTTLARAIAGLHPDGSGELRLHGAALPAALARRTPALRRRIQMVFQDPDTSLNPSHTVRRILRDGPGVEDDLMDRRPATLSGGQKQRVAIARSFAGPPDLVICDEPVSALDVSVQAAVLEQLAEQRERTGTAYLFISHDLAVVGYLADRIAVLYRGVVIEHGLAAAVLAGPHHPYTAALVGAEPSAVPAGPTAPAAGCRYFTACTRRIAGLCNTTAPPAAEPAPGHVVRCHLEPAALPRGAAPAPIGGVRA